MNNRILNALFVIKKGVYPGVVGDLPRVDALLVPRIFLLMAIAIKGFFPRMFLNLEDNF